MITSLLALAILIPAIYIAAASLLAYLISYVLGMFFGSVPYVMTIINIIIGLMLIVYILAQIGVSV